MNEMRPPRCRTAAVGIENNKVDRQSSLRKTTKTSTEILRFCHCSSVSVLLSPRVRPRRPDELCQKGKLVILSKVCPPPRLRCARSKEDWGAGTSLESGGKGKGREGEDVGRNCAFLTFAVYTYLPASSWPAQTTPRHATPTVPTANVTADRTERTDAVLW